MREERWRKTKGYIRAGVGRLEEHCSFLVRAMMSPYRFPLKELWCRDPCTCWSLPKVEQLSHDGDWLRLEVGGLRFVWPIQYDPGELPWLYNEVFTPAERNRHAYEFRQVRIERGDWVIDGGAGEGFFTAYALARGANVLAVEPVKLLCEALCQTFEAEVRVGRVKILHGGLGASDGIASIRPDPKSVCTAAVEGNEGEPIRVYAIDTIVSEGIIPAPAFIKMDIEGAEVDALRGGKVTLRACRPKLAIAVYHQLHNAKLAKQIVLCERSNYMVTFRGMYAWDRWIPRPYMLFAS